MNSRCLGENPTYLYNRLLTTLNQENTADNTCMGFQFNDSNRAGIHNLQGISAKVFLWSCLGLLASRSRRRLLKLDKTSRLRNNNGLASWEPATGNAWRDVIYSEYAFPYLKGNNSPEESQSTTFQEINSLYDRMNETLCLRSRLIGWLLLWIPTGCCLPTDELTPMTYSHCAVFYVLCSL